MWGFRGAGFRRLIVAAPSDPLVPSTAAATGYGLSPETPSAAASTCNLAPSAHGPASPANSCAASSMLAPSAHGPASPAKSWAASSVAIAPSAHGSLRSPVLRTSRPLVAPLQQTVGSDTVLGTRRPSVALSLLSCSLADLDAFNLASLPPPTAVSSTALPRPRCGRKCAKLRFDRKRRATSCPHNCRRSIDHSVSCDCLALVHYDVLLTSPGPQSF